ncbi:hypothetical protein RAA17_06810 [Komagataeibacter rhaeticus]|nr:hypothetical protein [Komagataeibacter rhaeticus]
MAHALGALAITHLADRAYTDLSGASGRPCCWRAPWRRGGHPCAG